MTSGLGQPTGQTGRTWGGTTGDSRADSGPSGGGVRQHLGHLHKALIPLRQKTSEAGQGSSREGKGPGGCLSLQDEDKKKTSFLFCTVHRLVVSRGECRSR